jgi:uncharacterized protein (TIGR03437 family)
MLDELDGEVGQASWPVRQGCCGSAPITYAGPQGTYEGLDQVNLQLPRALASPPPGTTVLRLTVDGQPTNQVTLLIQ